MLNVNSVSTTYTSSLPKSNRDFLAKHQTPIKKNYPDINKEDPQYKKKMDEQCQEILKQLKQDYSLAFSNKIKPDQLVDVHPVHIHVREDVTSSLPQQPGATP